MVAAVVVGGEPSLRVIRAAEFSPPDECFVEHSPLLEIGDESRRRLVGLRALPPGE